MNRHLPIALVAVVFVLFDLQAHGQSLDLQAKPNGQYYQVAVTLDGEEALASPAEGLWSIATDWKEGWPANWVHAGPMVPINGPPHLSEE